jgi:hypothetical protein
VRQHNRLGAALRTVGEDREGAEVIGPQWNGSPSGSDGRAPPPAARVLDGGQRRRTGSAPTGAASKRTGPEGLSASGGFSVPRSLPARIRAPHPWHLHRAPAAAGEHARGLRADEASPDQLVTPSAPRLTAATTPLRCPHLHSQHVRGKGLQIVGTG